MIREVGCLSPKEVTRTGMTKIEEFDEDVQTSG